MNDPPRKPSRPDDRELAAFLRLDRERVLAEWERVVQTLPCAAKLPRPELRDSLPQVLDTIAGRLEHPGAGEDGRPLLADQHALERLREGFDLAEVVEELSLLRACVLRLWSPPSVGPSELDQIRRFDRAIDQCVTASAIRFGESQARSMKVLDGITTASLRADSLEDLLGMLIVAFQEESPSVDTTTIALLEQDRLRVHAAAGVEAGMKSHSVRIGEGFAGRVAAARRPLEISSAATDPVVASEVIRRAGVRALHGVPLIDSGKLIGVACMGSLTAGAFSEQDRTLFASMASRAAAGIAHHQLQEAVRARAAALLESEKRFRDTFENAAIGLGHLALDGAWLRMNDHYCALLGYTRDELLALRIQDVTHPDDAPADVENIGRLVTDELDRYTAEKRCVRRDGSVVWVDQTLSLVRDSAGEPSYLIAAAQNVSARVRQRDHRAFIAAASAVLTSTLDYQQTIDNIATLLVPRIADACVIDLLAAGGDVPEPAAVLHDDGDDWVPVLRARYPLRMDSADPVAAALRDARPQLVRDVGEQALRQFAVDAEHFSSLSRLGLRSMLVLPLTAAGQVIGALTLAHGASGRRFDGEDVELLREFASIASTAIENAHLHAESQRAVHLRDRVLGIVTHDLRNPIGTIDLSATLLTMNRSVIGDAAAREQTAVIQRNVRRATRLIEDLLDMSSVQAGRLAIERSEQRLAAVLGEAVEIHRHVANDKGIAFAAELDVGDTAIFGDHDRLLQVLNNVIGNALKFSKKGDSVTVRAESAEGTATISVADTGPGISARQLEHIFDPYVRVRSDEHGTGLGLFIARAIVNAHGGRIWAQSEQGAGTTIFIALPLAEGPAPDSRGA